MDFKLTIDITKIESDLKEQLTTRMRNVVVNQTTNFFDKERRALVNGVWQYDKGDGLKQIDEMIENKFLDPKFQESLDRFFEHNWEAIFKECMTKALQHKANGIAFNKSHKLNLS